MTWVETGSGFSPSLAQTYSSTAGSMLAKVPTAPEMAPVAIFSRAASQAAAVARHLGVPAGEFEAEGHRLGVDAVRAPHADGVLMLEGAVPDRFEEHVEIGEEFVGGLDHLHRQAGIENIGGGHPLVDEAGFGADEFGDGGEKGDDIVLDLGFDGIDAGDVEIPLFADDAHRFFGNDAELRLFFAGERFDLQPDAETVFRFPDAGHFLAGIAFDHPDILLLSPDRCQRRGRGHAERHWFKRQNRHWPGFGCRR